ncbi:unnamed protein product [Linum tenue]|uniref:Uncharacterized protein n=1 Tax=Linum tenue TaxID=586396 RepID=A0AAV0N435_9ROSI|nr:unnamed protein product [Linum tenue]
MITLRSSRIELIEGRDGRRDREMRAFTRK